MEILGGFFAKRERGGGGGAKTLLFPEILTEGTGYGYACTMSHDSWST